jgi:hypothetical protein
LDPDFFTSSIRVSQGKREEEKSLFSDDIFVGSSVACQMVYFQTKNPNLGKFWRALDLQKCIHFTDIWDLLRSLGTFCVHLVHFSNFGIMDQEKSGNPGRRRKKRKSIIAFLVDF